MVKKGKKQKKDSKGSTAPIVSTEKEHAYQEKMEAQLGEWQAVLEEQKAKLNQLRARAEQLEADAKIAVQEAMDGVEKRRDEARAKIEAGNQQLQKLKAQGEEAGTTSRRASGQPGRIFDSASRAPGMT